MDRARQVRDSIEQRFGVLAARLIFIDETGTSTKMARTHGHAPRGERLRMGVPHGHWKTTTLVAGLSCAGSWRPS